VVGEAFYLEYQRMLESEPALEAAVGRYGIRWLIFPYATNGSLLGRLSRDSRWRLAYVDSLSVIFVREGPGAEAAVDPALGARLRMEGAPPRISGLPGLGGGARPGAAGRWLAGLARRERFPDEDFNLGLFHFFRGEPVRAERRFARAIQQSGGAYYEMYANLAASLYWQRRFEEARACDRLVLRADPGNRLARERLSRSHP